MYLVMTIQHNRMTTVKAFSNWYRATLYADELAIRLNKGVSKEMMDWENSGYRNVYETRGVAVMIEECDEPKVEAVS